MASYLSTIEILANIAVLAGLLNTAAASEPCLITPFIGNTATFYIRCSDYCCRSLSNATQYCCSECRLSVGNSDTCGAEQLWRYILYIGLGIAGSVVLCYLIAYVVKNCKEPLKHNCCRQRGGRVRDPAISMTRSSAWVGSARPHRTSRVDRNPTVDGDGISDGCEAIEDPWHQYYNQPSLPPALQPPPPPAYSTTVASPSTQQEQQLQQQQQQEHQLPPPNYSEAATASAELASPAAVEEPPPAYSATDDAT